MSEGSVMKVAIIGGEKSLIDGNWGRRLAEHGLEVVAHVHDKNKTAGATIPKDAQGVIVIRDMARHTIADPAREEAERRGLPVACVTRKWSHAEPILRTQGLLPPLKVVPAVVPSYEQRKTVAIAYIKAARAEGRVPKQDEVLGALQRACGPRAMLGVKEYTKFAQEAAGLQPLVPKPDAPNHADEAAEWGVVIIAERPEILLDREDYLNQVAAIIGHPPSPEEMEQVRIGAAAAVTRAHRGWRDDPQAARGAMLKWLKGWWQRWQRGEAPFPRNTEVHDHARLIFGVSIRSEVIKEARAAVVGEWARELVELSEAQRHLDIKLATVRPVKADIRELLVAGAIKGIEVVSSERKGRWYTSELAINDYVSTLTPEVAPAPVPEVVPTPAPQPEAPTSPSVVDQVRELLAPLVADLADIKTRLTALEAKDPVVNVDVGVDLTELNARVEALAGQVSAIDQKLVPPAAPSFAEAMEVVIAGVKDRQVEVAIRPLPVSRG